MAKTSSTGHPTGRLSRLTRWVHGLHFRNVRGDLFGGLTAAIVALPLALAFGVSSGIGPTAGLYGAICVGFFAALFGGTPSQISGPTGPMSVVMASLVATAATNPNLSLATVFTIVMLGGCFQILFGLFRLGKYLTLIPYTVISGFMSGIGVIIILLQIPPLFGFSAAGMGVIEILSQLPSLVTNFSQVVTQINGTALFLGLLTLGIVFNAPPRLNKIIPAPLLALIFCSLLSVLFFGDSNLARIGEIQAGLPNLHWPQFSPNQLKDIVVYSLMLATLGSIDSLLTSLVADNITRTQHDSDRELIGQGIGNLLSGFIGGLPGAGATMRTVVNVQSGGKTPISGIVHALVLLLIMVQFRALTEPIPNAVLSGILLKVGVDIIDWGFIKRAHRLSRKGATVMYVVLGLTVLWDLVIAVAVGVFLANLLTIQNLTEVQARNMKTVSNPEDDPHLGPEERAMLKQASERVLMFCLSGPMSFGAAKSISQRLPMIQNYEVLILDLTTVTYFSVTAMLAIETMVKDAFAHRRHVLLVGVTGSIELRFRPIAVMRHVPAEQRFSDRTEALRAALSFINASAAPRISEPQATMSQR